MLNNIQTKLNIWLEAKLYKKRIIIKNVIIDRKSKYSVVWWYVENSLEISEFMKNLLKDNYFRKATHNTYAYRIKLENWSIIESKKDDWEIWAWMCVLREIQRVNWINMIIVVTRYFGGVKLNTDRFKNVINACKIFFWKNL